MVMEGERHDGREETVKGAAVSGWVKGKGGGGKVVKVWLGRGGGWEWFLMEGQAKMGSFTLDHPLTSSFPLSLPPLSPYHAFDLLTDYTPLWYSMNLQWQTLPKQEASCLQNPAYRPRRF